MNNEAFVIMKDWIFKKKCQWQHNKAFKKDIFKKNKNNRVKNIKDSNLLKYFIFMMSLRKTIYNYTEKSKSFENLSNANIKKLYLSANTLKSENFSQIS